MKKTFAISIFLILILSCFTACSNISGELNYSALTGLWGSKEGDMLLSLGTASNDDIYHGAFNYYENGELIEDKFTYILSYDEKSGLNILCITVDDYSETYEVKLKKDVLTLTIYSEETGTKEETVFVRGNKLIEPESTAKDSELRPTTTSYYTE